VSVADFDRDVADPENRKWEEFVMLWLKNHQHREVRDRRWLNGTYDFEVQLRDDGPWKTLDVKADHRLFYDRDNVFFEVRHVYDDQHESTGWGYKPGLDMLAYVSAEKYQLFILDVPQLRRLAEEEIHAGRLREREVPNQSRGRRWTTFGYAIPLITCWKRHVILFAQSLWVAA
jgi:hypothetical protein